MTTLTHFMTQQFLSDAELARRALDEPAAFGELYQRYLNPVYRYHLARTGLPAEAEDLTAETFLAALQALPSYRGAGSFTAWLFGIARRKLASHYRFPAPPISNRSGVSAGAPRTARRSRSASRLYPPNFCTDQPS